MNQGKKFPGIVIVAVILFLGRCAVSAPSIIPQPGKLVIKEGSFVINSETQIACDPETVSIGSDLSSILNDIAGINLEVVSSPDTKQKPIIHLSIDDTITALGEEGYLLEISPDQINIKAAEAAGVFYGVQTLRQIIASTDKSAALAGLITLPCLEIEDVPRFKWRGLMLDVARHFQPKEFVLKYIDAMSLFKLNHLHLHLTDDQGCRLEIKAIPNLTKIGAWREASTIADELSMAPSGPAHGGFYTQEDMREIIDYAATRYITIVPEIELPGHAQAALASVKGLSCSNERFKVRARWGVNPEVFCAGSERTFKFLETVLEEVAELFPAPYIHIGGDEVPKTRWKECPLCQERIKEHKLKDEHELQSYFISRIEEFVNSKGKQIIGWDEILEGGLPPRATVMSWRGVSGGIEAARQGHDVIMSPTSHCYLDYRQSPEKEPDAIGSPTVVLPLCRVYSFEPVADELSADEANHILGVQGNLWTEFVEAASHAMYMTYPRAMAIAEIGWSTAEARNYEDFKVRMNNQFQLLETMDINFRKPRATDDQLCD